MSRKSLSSALCISAALSACAPTGDGADGLPIDPTEQALSSSTRAKVEQYFDQGQWLNAISTCQVAELIAPNDCEARYCELLGRTMVFVDQLNNYLLPRFRFGASPNLFDLVQLLIIDRQLADMATAADNVTSRRCTYDLPHLPLRIGDATDPIVQGWVRGRHTLREAYLLGAIANSTRYTLQNLYSSPAVPPPPAGETVPGLPVLLEKTRAQIAAQYAELLNPQNRVTSSMIPSQGGWFDRNQNGIPDEADELVIDIFTTRDPPSQRVFDFSGVPFVTGERLGAGALPPPLEQSGQGPPCAYETPPVITTLASGTNVGRTDGMSFSPDGTRLALPMVEPVQNGKYQIYAMDTDGYNRVCLTCGQGGANDGVRWQPKQSSLDPDMLIFISNRDHPLGYGGAGGGAGQELYAMRLVGNTVTRVDRLTQSHSFATNYHVNFSEDGTRVAWGRTNSRTWDVMVADFKVDPSTGRMFLDNQKLVARDTTWWEPHGFTPDNSKVLATNSRSTLLGADIYAVDVNAPNARVRLTTDPSWDEHAHVSPHGYKMAWMSGRARPASMLRLNDPALNNPPLYQPPLAPLFDFYWINPEVLFGFVNPPAGYATELYIMNPDGTGVKQLTFDGKIVADSQWSMDGRKILFRQSDPTLGGASSVRILSFTDCK